MLDNANDLATYEGQLVVAADGAVGGSANIAIVNAATGALNTSIPISTNRDVNAVIVVGSVLYLGGEFSTVTANAATSSRSSLAAIDLGTVTVTSFDPDVDDYIHTMAVSDSTLYFGGEFEGVGPTERLYAAAVLLSDGSLTSWNPAFDDPVNSLAYIGGQIFVGGEFEEMSGDERRYFVGLNPTSAAVTTSLAVSGPVLALTNVNNGLAIGGDFEIIGGVARTSIAALDHDTGEATAFAVEVDGDVRAMAFSADGSTLYFGGQFTNVGGQVRGSVAAVNATTGALQAGFDAQGSFLDAVKGLVVHGTNVWVGGDFDSMGGQAAQHLAVLDGSTGSYVSTVAVDNDIESLKLSEDGDHLYVTGRFGNFGGQARSRLAVYDIPGAAVTSLSASFSGPLVSTREYNGLLYVYGWFSQVNAQNRGGACAFNLNTGSLTSFDPDAQAAGGVQVTSFEVTADAAYLVGSIDTVGGEIRNNAAAVDRTTGAVQSPVTIKGLSPNRTFKRGSDIIIEDNGRISTFADDTIN